MSFDFEKNVTDKSQELNLILNRWLLDSDDKEMCYMCLIRNAILLGLISGIPAKTQQKSFAKMIKVIEQQLEEKEEND